MRPPKISSYRLDQTLVGETPLPELNAAEQAALAKIRRRYGELSPDLARFNPAAGYSPLRLRLAMAFNTAALIKAAGTAIFLAALSGGLVYVTRDSKIATGPTPVGLRLGPTTWTPAQTNASLQTEHSGTKRDLTTVRLTAGDIVSARVDTGAIPVDWVAIYALGPGGELSPVYPSDSEDKSGPAGLQGEWTMPYRFLITENGKVRGFLVLLGLNTPRADQAKGVLAYLQAHPASHDVRREQGPGWIEAHLLMALP